MSCGTVRIRNVLAIDMCLPAERRHLIPIVSFSTNGSCTAGAYIVCANLAGVKLLLLRVGMHRIVGEYLSRHGLCGPPGQRAQLDMDM